MDNKLNEVVALAKRRGFVYPSSDIYGGMANTWDFGPVGTLLKNNVRDSWWKYFVLDRNNMVGVDASIFLNPKVWEASGHVSSFTDALIDCKHCHLRTRADHLIENYFDKQDENTLKRLSETYVTSDSKIDESRIKKSIGSGKVEGIPLYELDAMLVFLEIKCPKCGSFDWTPIRKFNLLFETSIGILEGEKNKAYLRGEIAQGIFLNFKNVLDTTRVRVPFGIAQQGKAFRNEITLGQFIHRTLEFDLMEFEYFIRENDWEKTFDYWKEEMWKWTEDLGIHKENLRWREHEEFERSHYSKKTMDIEYKYPFGWKEMFGIAYRTDFDLKNHGKHSGKDLSFTDPETNEKYIPHVIEPTFGLSRLIGVLLFDAYTKEDDRVVLRLSPKIAPYKAAVFPLLANKEELVKKAEHVHKMLKDHHILPVVLDSRGNIGKRYYAQDEIGTPFCITIDFQTLEDDSVTVRDRDTMKQERIKISELAPIIKDRLK